MESSGSGTFPSTPPSSTPAESTPASVDRRSFLRSAGAATAAGLALATSPGIVAAQSSRAVAPPTPHPETAVSFPPIHAATDPADDTPGPFNPPDGRVGFAVVGLGRLACNQILPAMAKSKYCNPVALVSGSPDRARKIAAQYGIAPDAIYDYANFDRLAQNPAIHVIYIILPNSMHAEFVIRGARTGKHILCEKPMATSVPDCERMIAACRTANVKLMIAYRQQYEPNNRALLKMVRDGKLGTLRSIIASNTQNESDPQQWRLRRAMAGGGCLPDVGIYCLNAARFLSGEEPSEVTAHTFQPKDDPRFTEVEATASFTLRFPSGLLASCSTGYAGHHSQFLRLEGSEAWAELNPAFGYSGLKLRHSRLVEGHEQTCEAAIEAKDQFAEEMDHMAECIMTNATPHTPGEEGLRDQRILEALYQSARTGHSIRL